MILLVCTLPVALVIWAKNKPINVATNSEPEVILEEPKSIEDRYHELMASARINITEQDFEGLDKTLKKLKLYGTYEEPEALLDSINRVLENRQQVAITNKRQLIRELESTTYVVNDEVERITWYYASESSTGSPLYLYIGRRNDSDAWMRIVFRYSGSSWLFVNKITIRADEYHEVLEPSYDEFKRVSGGGVSEKYDIDARPFQTHIAWKLSEAKTSIIRFHGDNGVRDFTLTTRQKRELAKMLEIYEAITLGI